MLVILDHTPNVLPAVQALHVRCRSAPAACLSGPHLS